MPEQITDTTHAVYGVRWTNEVGDITVHETERFIADELTPRLRDIQARRGAVPDAGVVTRHLRDGKPIDEWTAVGPGTETTS